MLDAVHGGLRSERSSDAPKARVHLHGSYPLAPRWLSVIGADLEERLAAEAPSLLTAVASGIPVESERLRAFARACLELSEVGRLALAVLEGGVFAPRRALELAGVVSDAIAIAEVNKRSEM